MFESNKPETFRLTCVLVMDNNSFFEFSEGRKENSEGIRGCFGREAANEELSEGDVSIRYGTDRVKDVRVVECGGLDDV